MPKLLTRLKIREISSVDRGAGDGVKILLMKKDGDEPYWKREFSREQRDRAASSGAAESDGSYPIENASDLHNAMRAIGRSKNPSKTRAHIRARARALGLSSELSDSFKRNDAMPTIAERFAKIFGGVGGNAANSAIIDKSIDGLAESITSILGDEEADKGAALTKTIEQFGDHLKSTLTAGDAVVKNEGSAMDFKELAKALGLADSATEADVIAAIAKNAGDVRKLQKQVAHAKAGYSDEEVAYLRKASLYDEEEDDGDNKLSGDEKKKQADFAVASHEERAKIMRSAEPPLPGYVQKIMDEVAVLKAQNAELIAKTASHDFAKRAVDSGLGEGNAETLRKAYAGDASAIDQLLGIIKGAHAAAAAGEVFKEFGTSQGSAAPDDPMAALTVKADELRKVNPNLSQAQAFAKVYEDPANADLARKERVRNRPQAA